MQDLETKIKQMYLQNGWQVTKSPNEWTVTFASERHPRGQISWYRNADILQVIVPGREAVTTKYPTMESFADALKLFTA